MKAETNKIYCAFFVIVLLHLGFPLKSQVFQNDTIRLCHADSVLLEAGGGYGSYLWNTAETTPSIYAKYSGLFQVEVNSGQGNVIRDSVYVSLGRPELAFHDTLACYGSDLELYLEHTEPVTLVGYYPFTSDSYFAGDFVDYSGYGNNVSTFTSVRFMNGRESGTDAVQMRNSTFFIYGNDTNYFSKAFTIHCWLCPDSAYGANGGSDSTYYIFNHWNSFTKDNASSSFALVVNNEGQLSFMTSDGIDMQSFTVTDSLYYLECSKWTMVDVVCSMNRLMIFIDSQKVVDDPIHVFPQKLESSSNLYYVGSSPAPSYNHNYNGGIADLRLYISDLTDSELYNLYKINTTYNYEYDWSRDNVPLNEYDRVITINPTDSIGEYYKVDVSDEMGGWHDERCPDSVFVRAYPEIVIEMNQISIGCPETSEGGFIVNVTGGVPKSDTSNVSTKYDITWPKGYPHVDSLGWVSRLPEGTFTVTVTDSVGCELSQTIDIEVHPAINDSISVEPSVIYRQKPQAKFKVSFNSECYIDSYYWDLGDGTISTEPEVEHNYGDIADDVSSFVIVSVLTDEYGCVDSTNVTLEVRDAELVIPNVFTPNGDGVNETFKVSVADDEGIMLSDIFESNSLTVYNRQGRIVYQKQNYESEEFDGKGLSDGVYFYVLICKGQIKTETYRGYVHIFTGTQE